MISMNTQHDKPHLDNYIYYKTTTFGLKCIYKRCIDSWNKFSIDINTINRKNNINNPEVKDIDLLNYSRKVLKDKLTKHVLSTYIE